MSRSPAPDYDARVLDPKLGFRTRARSVAASYRACDGARRLVELLTTLMSTGNADAPDHGGREHEFDVEVR